MIWRRPLGLAGAASVIALACRGLWVLAGLVGAGVGLVIVLAPVTVELRGIWVETAAQLRRSPEPAPAPTNAAPVSPGTGEGYVCGRCERPAETDWASPSARAASDAGVCGECFGILLGALQECRTSDDDETMRVEADAPDCPPGPADDADDTYPSGISGTGWQQPA